MDKLPSLNILFVKLKFTTSFVQVVSSICLPSPIKRDLVCQMGLHEGAMFASLFSYSGHPFLRLHTHTLFKGPLELHLLRYQQPL